MKLTKFITGALLAAALAVPASLQAVPAYPGPIKVTQADGSQLTIRLFGDEYGSYATTEDNHLLLRDGGSYCYATLAADGRVVSTGVRASEMANRTAAERTLLAGINDAQTISARQAEIQTVASPLRADYAKRFRAPSFVVSDGKMRLPSNMSTTTFPCIGEQKALVILVEFADVDFSTPNPHDYFTRMLNEDNFNLNGGTGSAHEYFLEVSGGQFDCDFDLYGPVKLSRDRSYYGANPSGGGVDQNAREMIREACSKLNSEIDYTQYDRDGDGNIDNVFVFYAGTGEATSGDPDDIWPHSANWYGIGGTFDGKKLSHYACSNEWVTNYDASGRPDGIGTFVHEFAHVMGLPDLYHTTAQAAYTPGDWSCLDSGPYLNEGCTPPAYSGFERLTMGWIEPREIKQTVGQNFRLENLNDANDCAYIQANNSNEFWIFENRQKTGIDKYLPGHGLLVWHIDYNQSRWKNNTVNNTASHQYVDIVEASGSYTQPASFTFPGTKSKTALTATTTPALKDWNGGVYPIEITNIAEKGGVITFKVNGGAQLLDAVTAQAATDINSRGFRASWTANPKAVDYQITVSDAEGNPVAGYDHLSVDNVLEYRVTGLQPETAYTYTVKALSEDSESPESNAVAVTTGVLTFEYIIPVATAATNIADGTFTANWEAVDGASEYLLDVYTLKVTSEEDYTLNFDLGVDLPDGWTTTATKTYATAGYSGAEIPSLRLPLNGEVVSSEFDGDITAISLWTRSPLKAAQTSSNSLRVEGFNGAEWVEIETFSPDATGGVKTIENVPSGLTRVRFLYSGSRNGDLALDDVKVTYATGYEKTNVLQGASAGASLSKVVNGLAAGTYNYVVRGFNGTLKTLASNEIAVKLNTGGAGILDVVVDSNAPARYFNLQGIEVPASALTPGVYIRLQGEKSTKVLVK